jgi:hypothetical protein
LTVNQNVRCEGIIPGPEEPHTGCPAGHSSRWKGDTIAFHLTKAQAIDLAKVLLVGSQEWNTMSVTAFRRDRRKADGTYPVTVTGESDTQEQESTQYAVLPQGWEIMRIHLVTGNPKRGASAKRFALYREGMITTEYIATCVQNGTAEGAAKRDMGWDIKHKFIELIAMRHK